MFAAFLPPDIEVVIAEQTIAHLRGLVAQLDLAIANYQDAYAQLRASS